MSARRDIVILGAESGAHEAAGCGAYMAAAIVPLWPYVVLPLIAPAIGFAIGHLVTAITG